MAKSKKLVKPRVQRKPRGKTTKKMNRKNPVNKLTKRKPYKKVAKRKTHKKKGSQVGGARNVMSLEDRRKLTQEIECSIPYTPPPNTPNLPIYVQIIFEFQKYLKSTRDSTIELVVKLSENFDYIPKINNEIIILLNYFGDLKDYLSFKEDFYKLREIIPIENINLGGNIQKNKMGSARIYMSKLLQKYNQGIIEGNLREYKDILIEIITNYFQPYLYTLIHNPNYNSIISNEPYGPQAFKMVLINLNYIFFIILSIINFETSIYANTSTSKNPPKLIPLVIQNLYRLLLTIYERLYPNEDEACNSLLKNPAYESLPTSAAAAPAAAGAPELVGLPLPPPPAAAGAPVRPAPASPASKKKSIIMIKNLLDEIAFYKNKVPRDNRPKISLGSHVANLEKSIEKSNISKEDLDDILTDILNDILKIEQLPRDQYSYLVDNTQVTTNIQLIKKEINKYIKPENITNQYDVASQ